LSLPLKLHFDNSQFVPLTRVISRWLLLILWRLKGERAAQSTLPNNFGITGGSTLLQLSNSRELFSPLGGQECPAHMMVNICAKGLPLLISRQKEMTHYNELTLAISYIYAVLYQATGKAADGMERARTSMVRAALKFTADARSSIRNSRQHLIRNVMKEEV
jgi:hypothetical protein